MREGLTIAALLFSLCICTTSFAQVFENDIFINNSNTPYDAKITNITLTIEPKGIFTEFCYYFDYSLEDIPVAPGTPMRGVYGFRLTPESAINDLWLWVNDKIHRASLKSIVDEFQPGGAPNLQYNYLLGQYYQDYRFTFNHLIKGAPNRRFKLSFLEPNVNLLGNNLISPLHFGEGEIRYRIFLKGPWQSPVLQNKLFSSLVPLTQHKDEKLGTYYESPILPNNQHFLKTSSPLNKGIFWGLSPSRGGEKVYQLAVNLEEVLDSTLLRNKKLMLVFHAKTTTNNATLDSVKTNLINELQRVLTPKDSFNIVTDNLGEPSTVFNTWVPANPETILNAVNNLPTKGLNLPQTVIHALDFIKQHGRTGNILLVANTDEEYTPEKSNAAFAQIINTKGSLPIPFFILDFTTNPRSFRIESRISTIGNTPLYDGLVGVNSGWRTSLINPGLRLILGKCSKWIPQTSVTLSTKDNLSSDVFPIPAVDLIPNSNQIPIIRPRSTNINSLGFYAETGKIKGEPPYFLRISSQVADSTIRKLIPLDSQTMFSLDSIAWQAWAGAKIRTITDTYFSARTYNPRAKDIVDLSLAEGVLSRATSYVDYNPADPTEPCDSCMDRSAQVSTQVSDPKLDSLLTVKVVPNPFSDQTQIQLKFKAPIDMSHAKAGVYDHTGRLVKNFDELPRGQVNALTLRWNGLGDDLGSLPPGLYIFRLILPQGQLGVKMMRL